MADRIVLMVDGSFGFEMVCIIKYHSSPLNSRPWSLKINQETLECFTIFQSHGFSKSSKSSWISTPNMHPLADIIKKLETLKANKRIIPSHKTRPSTVARHRDHESLPFHFCHAWNSVLSSSETLSMGLDTLVTMSLIAGLYRNFLWLCMAMYEEPIFGTRNKSSHLSVGDLDMNTVSVLGKVRKDAICVNALDGFERKLGW